MNSVLTCIFNPLAKALNELNKLPCFVAIAANRDILDYVMSYEAGVSRPSGAAINWLANQIILAVNSKKDFLQRVKPGAISSYEPKVIWIKAIKHLAHEEQVTKFNKMMDEMLIAKSGHYVIDINTVLPDLSYYHENGSLNGFGKVRFWAEVDYQIEMFDQRKLSLKPNPEAASDSQEDRSSHSNSPAKSQQQKITRTNGESLFAAPKFKFIRNRKKRLSAFKNPMFHRNQRC